MMITCVITSKFAADYYLHSKLTKALKKRLQSNQDVPLHVPLDQSHMIRP